jgi:hypothetical protein
MTGMGVFAVERGVFDHPVFAPEPYTEVQAWIWMCGNAAWKPTCVCVGRHLVDLERGQLAFATRFLAVKFKWSETRIRRYFSKLKNNAMIAVSTTRMATHVTICNYEKYAFGRRTSDTQNDAQNVAKTTHVTTCNDDENSCGRRTKKAQSDAKKEKNKKELKEDAAVAAPEILNDEADLFRRGKAVIGKDAGGLITKLVKAKGSIPLARAAIELASSKENAREYIGAVVRGNSDAGKPTGAII